MIKFSEKMQCFYDVSLDYLDFPDDLVDINSDQHLQLLSAINEGYIIFSDLSLSDKKPSQFHIWDGKEWIENIEAKNKALYASNLSIAQNEYEAVTLQLDRINEQIEDEDFDEHSETELLDLKAKYTNYRKSLRAYLKTDGSNELPKL